VAVVRAVVPRVPTARRLTAATRLLRLVPLPAPVLAVPAFARRLRLPKRKENKHVATQSSQVPQGTQGP